MAKSCQKHDATERVSRFQQMAKHDDSRTMHDVLGRSSMSWTKQYVCRTKQYVSSKKKYVYVTTKPEALLEMHRDVIIPTRVTSGTLKGHGAGCRRVHPFGLIIDCTLLPISFRYDLRNRTLAPGFLRNVGVTVGRCTSPGFR